jgi:hypothetical protein
LAYIRTRSPGGHRRADLESTPSTSFGRILTRYSLAIEACIDNCTAMRLLALALQDAEPLNDWRTAW